MPDRGPPRDDRETEQRQHPDREQERYPLLDEILVIDSASTDDTRAIAEAEGARVVQHPDVLTRYGSFVCKG